MINGTSLTTPSLKTLFDKSQTRISQTLNCVKIGTIVDFDPVNRTATVSIAFKRSLSIPVKNDAGAEVTEVEYPKLYDCPVMSLQGGGGILTFPIEAGDECIVLFSDSNIDAWYENGGEEALVPYDGRRHDLSDGIAIVGINSLANPVDLTLPVEEVALNYGGAKISERVGMIGLSNTVADFRTAMDIFLTGLTPATLPAQAAALKVSIDALFYAGNLP